MLTCTGLSHGYSFNRSHNWSNSCLFLFMLYNSDYSLMYQPAFKILGKNIVIRFFCRYGNFKHCAVVCVYIVAKISMTLSNSALLSFLAMGNISPLLRYIAQGHQPRKYYHRNIWILSHVFDSVCVQWFQWWSWLYCIFYRNDIFIYELINWIGWIKRTTGNVWPVWWVHFYFQQILSPILLSCNEIVQWILPWKYLSINMLILPL